MRNQEQTIKEMGLLAQMAYQEIGKEKFEIGKTIDDFDDGENYKLSTEYGIIDHIDTKTDLQAVLLKDNTTGNYIIAFRGTGEKWDGIVDLKIGFKNINEQYADASSFTQKALATIANDKQCSIDEAKSYLTLTGHSLGGILTQQVGATYGIKGYAYNPYGVDRLLSAPNSPFNGKKYIGINFFYGLFTVALQKIMQSVGLTKSHANWAYEHIFNISYQDEGILNGDILSNFATNFSSAHLGKFIPIFGKNVGAGDGHSIVNLNKYIEEYNNILKHFNSNVTYKELTEAYLSTAMVHKGKGYEKLNEEFKKLGVFNTPENSLNLNVLTKDSSINLIFPNSSISTEALYALVNLNPFMISGISSKAYDELEKHRDEYSDEYVQDKAKMLAKALVSSFTTGEYYKDHQSDAELKPAFDESGQITDSPNNQFIFGSNKNDTIENIKSKLNPNTHTKIYALAGNDHITIAGGNAYIEAGSGSDTIDLRASKGENVVYGGVNNGKDNDDDGDDIVYGGEGIDTIYGGAGSDTYHVGDKDIIFDSDGKGKVFFDTVELTGGVYDKDKGAYLSEDGLIEYRLQGDKLTVKKDSSTITINSYEKEFKNEKKDAYLGITLLDTNEISISISDNQTNEGDGSKRSLNFNISLQGSIEKGEFLILGIGNKEYLFGNPSEEYIKKYNLNLDNYEIGNTYTYEWNGNTIKQEDMKFEITPRVIQTSDALKVKSIKAGQGTIIDDDDDDSPNDTFPDTTPASTKTSPIVIDLNSDGVKTISRKNNKIYFDLDNNKFAQNTAWIDKNDGILINKSLITNSITNGSELFGNHTLLKDGSLASNGFEALKEFDENSDGAINELDTLAYESLAIWQDINSNAKLDENELKSLKELSIKEINLNYNNSNYIDENGNEHRQISNVVFENGNKANISDVWLDTHTADTKYIGEKIVLSKEIKALPQVYAFGEVLNLRQAMAKDRVLQTMVFF